MTGVSNWQDVTGFDGDLQMFRETTKPVNTAHLDFLRWLIEHGRLDRPSAGVASGDLNGEAEPTHW